MYKLLQNVQEDKLIADISALQLKGYTLEQITSTARGLDEIVHTVILKSGDITITYNGNTNTSGDAPTDTLIYTVGAKAIVAGKNTLAKTNNRFIGWNTAANGTGTAYAAGSVITLDASITLYAIWQAEYTITYNGNTSTGGEAPTDAVKYLAEDIAVARTAGTLEKTDKTFVKWNTAADGSGTDYLPGAELTIAGNVTLYAIWSA